jgi:hypothetical protein
VTAELGRNTLDMGALVATDAKSAPDGITTGFSVDDAGMLHWKNDLFKNIGGSSVMYSNDKMSGQNGEAQWGFLKSETIGNGAIQLYAQLGCPMGTHEGLHDKLIVGSAKVVAR